MSVRTPAGQLDIASTLVGEHNVMNLLDNPNFIFNCPYAFTERFSGADDFFKPSEDVEPDPIRGLAMRRDNELRQLEAFSAYGKHG